MRPAGVLLLEDVKRRSRPVARNGSASLWDIGDGVACLEFHTKMNAIDAETLELIDKAIGIVAKDFKALVIYNEGSNFSVGANIGLALFAANVAVWPMVEDLVAKGQKVYRRLKHAPVSGGRGTVRHGARRRLRGLPQRRGGRGSRRDLHRPRRGRRLA